MSTDVNFCDSAQHQNDAHTCECHDSLQSPHKHLLTQMIATDIGNVRVNCTISEHSEAVVISCTFEIQNGIFGLESFVQSLRDIAEEAEKAGGIIGHIKSVIVEGSNTAHISITSVHNEPTVLAESIHKLSESTCISVVFIAYLIDASTLMNFILTDIKRAFE